MMKNYLRIARFDHWIKQLFILPGVFFATVLLRTTPNWKALFLTLLSTCFIASANYCINEWLDAKFDKFHPTKKNRPVVAGNMKGSIVYSEYVFFALLGLALAYISSVHVFYMALVLLVMGLVYNVRPLRSKDVPYVDVITESMNNAIRFMLGWFSVTTAYLPPSSLVFGYWMGGAFLMSTKRFAEFRLFKTREDAALYRKSFGRYTKHSLLTCSFFYAMMTVFLCGIFMVKYRIEFLLAIPLLCALFCLYFNMSYRTDSAAAAPEKLWQEKGLMLCLLTFFAVMAMLMIVDMPWLNIMLDPTFIGV